MSRPILEKLFFFFQESSRAQWFSYLYVARNGQDPNGLKADVPAEMTGIFSDVGVSVREPTALFKKNFLGTWKELRNLKFQG